MNLSEIFKESLLEAKKKKPSTGLTKKQKSDVSKKAKKGEDIGKKGKGFEKIASKAAKKYGSEEKGEKVAAAAMWKNIKRVKEGAVDEVSAKDTAGAIVYKAYINGDDNVKQLIKSGLSLRNKDTFDKFKAELLQADKRDVDDILKSLVPYINKIKDLDSKEVEYIKDTEKYSKSTLEEGEDHEVSMAKNSLKSIMKSVIELMQKLGNKERNIPGWIQDHISNAENFIDQAAQGFHELEYHGEEDEDEEEEEEGPGDDMGMIQPVDEKKLTKAEKNKREEIIKAIARKKGGKNKLKGKEYAIATAQAIKSAE